MEPEPDTTYEVSRMWARIQLGILLLLASSAVAQRQAPGAVSVRDLRVVRDTSNNLRVEITLSAPLGSTPSATLATSPNRVVLDLPNTLSDAKQQQLSVNYKGVRRVRLGLNSATPPITRVVVEMDEAHPYDLQSDGTQVTLIIGAAHERDCEFRPGRTSRRRVRGTCRNLSTPPGTTSDGEPQ